MRIIQIIESRFHSEEELHDYLAAELNFPEYYGKNRNALYDVLTDICDDTIIQMIKTVDNGMKAQEWVGKIRRVIMDAAKENPHLFIQPFEE